MCIDAHALLPIVSSPMPRHTAYVGYMVTSRVDLSFVAAFAFNGGNRHKRRQAGPTWRQLALDDSARCWVTAWVETLFHL